MENVNIDNEIKEYKQKLKELKVGYEKTIQDFVEKEKLNSLSLRNLSTKLNFTNYKTISSTYSKKDKERQSAKPHFTQISWGGEGSSFPNQIAATTNKGIAFVYNVTAKSIIHEINFTNSELNTICIEPIENNLLAAGGFDGGIYVSNINSSRNKDNDDDEEFKKFSGHQGVVSCCGFLSSTYLVSSSNDSVILLWDINSHGKYINSYHEHTSEVSGLDVNEQNGNIFATGSGDTTVKLWDIREKKSCVCTFKGSDSSVSCVKFLPGRLTTLATGSDDSSVRIYDLRALKELSLFKKSGDNNSINSIGFSKSGQVLFASSSNSNKINYWDIFDTINIPFYTYEHKGQTKGIKQLAIDSTGSYIGYITEDLINIIK